MRLKPRQTDQAFIPVLTGILIGFLLSAGIMAFIEVTSDVEVLRITKGNGRDADFRTIYMNNNEYRMHVNQIEHVYYSDDVIEIRHAMGDFNRTEKVKLNNTEK